MFASMTFIFLSLVELAIVGWAEKRIAQEERKKRSAKSLLETKRFSLASFRKKLKQPKSFEVGKASPLYHRPFVEQSNIPPLSRSPAHDSDGDGENDYPEHRPLEWRHASVPNAINNSTATKFSPTRKGLFNRLNGEKVDNVCARLFPISFLLFCLVYWGYYIFQSSYQPEFL